MTYLISVALIFLALVSLAIGVASSAVAPYLVAAVLSAIAAINLYRRARQNQERAFVTDAPVVRAPQWDRPIIRSNTQAPPEGLEFPEIAIDNYDELVAAEVLPTLETLSVDELQAVILREKHGMARTAIIRRAETLIDLTLGNGSAQRLASSPTQTITHEQALPVVEPIHESVRDDISVVKETPSIELIQPEPEAPKKARRSKKKDGPDLSL